jgi:hypothetical protein
VTSFVGYSSQGSMVVDVRRLASVVLVPLVILVGCSSQADRPFDLDSLVEALRGKGLAVGEVAESGLMPEGEPYEISGDQGMSTFTVPIGRNHLQVIEFDTPAEADSYGILLGTGSVDLPRAHMWRSGRIIVLFDGGNESLADAVSEILGAPTVSSLLAPVTDDQ